MTNLANLPGIGPIENPRPQHYRAAINYLINDLWQRPPSADRRLSPDPRVVLADRLYRTLRRIEWTRDVTQAQRAA